MNPENEKFNIDIDEEIAEGVYSNCAVIAHSPSEFVVDFIRIMPGVDKARVKSRVILAPEHAKRLMLSLQENIGKFEEDFGEIAIFVSASSNMEQMALNITSKGEA